MEHMHTDHIDWAVCTGEEKFTSLVRLQDVLRFLMWCWVHIIISRQKTGEFKGQPGDVAVPACNHCLADGLAF